MTTTHRNETLQPMVWVGCLASYNAGHLHGTWIDAAQDAETINDEIAAMLESSPAPNAESPSIFDTEHIPDAYSPSASGEAIAAIGAFIHEHGEIGLAIADYYGDLNEAIEAMEDRFAGVHDSIADYAEDLIDLSKVPEHLRPYIDMQSIARDMELGGEVHAFRVSEGVAVFRAH